MNIFITDYDPSVSAKNLCDKHVVKMILESAQILSTAIQKDQLIVGLYKPTHKHHPCVKAVIENEANKIWLVHHLNALLQEYTFRYGKIHKTQALFNEWFKCYLNIEIDIKKLTLPMCMSDEFKCTDVVQAYRNYYNFKKISLKKFAYTNRNMPDWIKDNN